MTEFHCVNAFISWVLGSMSIVIICFPVDEIIDFEINFIFLIKPVSYMSRQVRAKTNIVRTKRAFKAEIKNFFFIIFKVLPLKKKKKTFWKAEAGL